jgi:hypothetical protein
MAVCSHHIANVDTKVYHRQRAVLGTNPPNEPNLYDSRLLHHRDGVRGVDVVRLTDTLTESRFAAKCRIRLHDHSPLAVRHRSPANGDERGLAARCRKSGRRGRIWPIRHRLGLFAMS